MQFQIFVSCDEFRYRFHFIEAISVPEFRRAWERVGEVKTKQEAALEAAKIVRESGTCIELLLSVQTIESTSHSIVDSYDQS